MWETHNRDGVLGWLFIEFPEFTTNWRDYFSGDTDYAAFQEDLAKAPEQWDPIRGCDGLRKARWAEARRGKGKRGGLRVIYLLVPEACAIVLADVYDKDDADDLTAQQRKHLTQIAKQTKAELVKRLGKRGGK